jgi:hypothetical protein
MNERDDVEALGEGVGVADLLVPAVPLVVSVAQYDERHLRVLAPVLVPDFERPVVRGVVHDEDLGVVLREDRPRNPVEHLP